MKSFTNQTKTFNFFEELNGREIMHWIGTPCFIQEISKICDKKVTIVTIDGYVYYEIKSDDLESMDPGDLALFV